jgi:hypothetical protein
VLPEVNYILWQRRGYGVRGEDHLELSSAQPFDIRSRRFGRSLLLWRKLKSVAAASEKLHDDGRFVLLRLEPGRVGGR